MRERGGVFVALALVFLFVLSVGVVSAFWPFTVTGKVTDDYSTSAQNTPIPNVRTYDGLNEYAVTPASNVLTSKKAVSVGGWFNTKALRTGNNEITGSWVSKRNSFILSAETDGSVKFWVFLDDGWYSVSSEANRLLLNKWEHWVGTWDGATISLYRAGVIEASVAASGTLGATGDLCIAHDCGLPAPYDNRYFNGKAYDIRVYADALSEQAVKGLYREGRNKLEEMTTTPTTPGGGGGGTAQCTDSDSGLDVSRYGWTNFTSNSFKLIHEDECALVSTYDPNTRKPAGWQGITSCSGNDCYVQEAFCRTDDKGNFIDADADELIPCPKGCSMGSCALRGNNESAGGGGGTAQCTDSDSGLDYYAKGSITGKALFTETASAGTDVTIHSATEATIVYDPPGKQPQTFRLKLGEHFNIDGNIGTLKSIDVANQKITMEYTTLVDSCNGDKELIERACIERADRGVNYICPNGCSDGACVASSGSGGEFEFERLKKLSDSLREITTVTNDGSYVLQLKTTIKGGEVTIPLLYTNASGSFIGIGKSPSSRLVTSSETNRVLYNYTGGDRYMVVTLNDSRNPVSYLVRFNTYTAEGRANKTTVEYYSKGAWASKGDKKGEDIVNFDNLVSLKIDEVYISSGTKSVYVSAQDNRVKFNMLATREGLAIYLPTVSEPIRPYLYGITIEAGTTGPSILHFSDKFFLDVRGQDSSGNFEAGEQAIILLGHQGSGSSYYVDVNEIFTGRPSYSDPTNTNNIIRSTGRDVHIIVERKGPSSAPRTAVIYYSGSTTPTTPSQGGGGGGGGGGTSNSCATIGCSLVSSNEGSDKCIGFGTRTGGNYCALSGTMKAQGAAEATCENNYECGSNVCASGKCVDAGLFQKIIDFFRKFFGG